MSKKWLENLFKRLLKLKLTPLIVWLKHDSVDSSRLVPQDLKISSVPSTSFSIKRLKRSEKMVDKIDSYLFGITNMHLNHLDKSHFLHCQQNQGTIQFPFHHIVGILFHNLTKHIYVIKVLTFVIWRLLIINVTVKNYIR